MSSVQKRSAATLIIMVLVFITMIFGNKGLDLMRDIIVSGYVTPLLWAYVIGAVSIHTYVVVKPKKDIYGFFEKYSNSIYEIATYGFAGSTSIALLKGLFLQHFFEGGFFNGFSVFDMSSMVILSSFLLIYALLNTTNILIEAIFYSNVNEVSVLGS